MESLYSSFCKVEFLCYQGEPNWLGWLILLPLLLIVFSVLLGLWLHIFDIFKEIFVQVVSGNLFSRIIKFIKKKDKTFNEKIIFYFFIVYLSILIVSFLLLFFEPS